MINIGMFLIVKYKFNSFSIFIINYLIFQFDNKKISRLRKIEKDLLFLTFI